VTPFLASDEALDQFEFDTERAESYPLTALVHRAVLRRYWLGDDPLPQQRRSPIAEGRWNDTTQDTIYTSHYPLVAFVERADHLASSVTIQSALTHWDDPTKTSIVVYSLSPPTPRADFTWDGRLEQTRFWKGLLDPGPPFGPSQALAIVVLDDTGCHRFIAPSRPVLQRYLRLAWNSAFFVCTRDGQPCGSALPDRGQLKFVLERSGTDFPNPAELTTIP
jgi:hypothetical protein